VGRPGNSLKRKYYFSVEKYVSITARRTANTDVELAKFFTRHDKPQTNQKFTRVNFQLDCALTVCDMADTSVINTGYLLTDDYKTHSRQQNSRGMRRQTN
jgi:hypothetical protein